MRTDHPLTETNTAPAPAPVADHHASRTGMNFATFDNLPQAEALKAFLNRNGIDAHVQDERRLQRFWFLARAGAGLHVRVLEPSFARAEELLQGDRDSTLLMKHAVRCPSCQSYQVQFPSMTRNFILPTLIAQVGVWLGFMQREHFCEKCQFTWVQPRPAASLTGPNMFSGRVK